MKFIALAAAAAAIGACAPEEIRGPQTVRVVVFDAARDRFQLADRKLHSIEELTGLRGATTEFRTGARLVRDLRDEQQTLTCAEFGDSFVEDGGGRPSLSFIDDDGVWVAEDFDTLVMVSTYFNFEFSRDFFVAAGVPVAKLGGTTTFYEPTLISYDSDGSRSVGFDPKGFERCIAAFVFAAGDPLQEIPPGANLGVAAHEYSHLVFDRLVYGVDGGGSALPIDIPADRRLWALDEGLADFFGAAIIEDPNFVSRAIPTAAARARNLSPGGRWSQGLQDSLESDATPDPYAMGTVWASFFWDIAILLPDGQAASASLAVRTLKELSDVDAAPGKGKSLLATAATEDVLHAVFVAARQTEDEGAELDAACVAFVARFAQFRLFPIDDECGP